MTALTYGVKCTGSPSGTQRVSKSLGEEARLEKCSMEEMSGRPNLSKYPIVDVPHMWLLDISEDDGHANIESLKCRIEHTRM